MKKKILLSSVALVLLSVLIFVVATVVQAPKFEGTVKIEKVKYNNRFGMKMVGNLYSPMELDPSKKYPAVAIAHPFGGVKEQTASLHAKGLAERGIIALAFDGAFYGESAGAVRNTESPDMRVEDFCAAVDFLSNHKNINPEKIGIVGLCGGGGYAIAAAKIDTRIKALAVVSYVEMGERTRNQSVAQNAILSTKERQEVLKKISDQRTKDFSEKKTHYVSNIPTKGPHEFYEYYRTERGSHPRATTDYALASNAALMNFYPLQGIELISPRAILFVVGERALLPKNKAVEAPTGHFSQTAYDLALEPKELYIVPDASHVDLYDNPIFMKPSLDKLESFFIQNL